MKKTTKKLLTFALSTLFIGAGIGAVTTFDKGNANIITASAEDSATVLDGTFSSRYSGTGSTYYADAKYSMYSVYLTSTVPFKTDGGVYLNDHRDTFGIDLMDYIYINGKSARAIFDGRGTAEEVEAKYPGFDFFLADWAPVLVEVAPSDNNGTAIRVDIDRRYIPVASIEVTFKACEFTYNGATYKLNADESFKATLENPTTSKANRSAVVMKKASEVNEIAVETPFKTVSKWGDEGNYYKFMVSTRAATFDTAYGGWTWLMDNIVYLQDYLLVNGRSVAEIQKEDSKDGIDFTGSPIQGSANYDFLVAPQLVTSDTESYVAFNINKDWAAANGLALDSIQLTVKAGFVYQGIDGKLYRTTTDFSAPHTIVDNGAFDTSRIAAGVSETGIGVYEIGTTGLDMVTINCGWHLAQLDTKGGFNEGDESNIYINGKSVAELNAIDDTGFVYTDIGWPNDFHSAFHKPVIVNFTEDKFRVFIHPELMNTLVENYVEIEIKNSFEMVNAEYTHRFTIPALENTRVWSKPVTLKVITGNQRLDPTCVATYNYLYGDTVAAIAEPTAEGKTFAGWINVEGEAVSIPETITEDMTIYASWNVTPYTLTIVNGEDSTDFTFGVEAAGEIMLTPNDLAYVLADNLPEDTADYTYAWEEEIPETFELKDYTFTVVATFIDYVEFQFRGAAVEVEIPAGKYATSEIYTVGDYVISWTGDATVSVNGSAIENGAVINVPNPMMPIKVAITPVNAEEACVVTFNMETYVAPLTVLEKDVEAVVNVTDTWQGVFVEFTAPAAGTYVLKPGADETNAWVDTAYYNDNFGAYDVDWNESLRGDVFASYEFEATEEGQKFYFWVSTWDEMPGEVSLIVVEKVDEPEIPESSEDVSSEESSEDVSSEEESSDDVTSEESSEDVSKPESSEEASDSASASESESSDSLLAGCFGSVSGLGVAALGLAAVVLFKKKED